MKCRICDESLTSSDHRCPNCKAVIDDYHDCNYDYFVSELDDEDLKYFLG